MLRPRPVRPLEMSMVVSQPGMMGQVVGSEARAEGVDERLRSETEGAERVRRNTEILIPASKANVT